MPRRLIYRRFGEVDVLQLQSQPTQSAGTGEVRIAVAYAGVNYADVIARRGFYKWAPPPPTCVGFEVAGTVIEVGPGVSTRAVGDRVMAVTRFGGYADEVVVEAERTWKVPAHKSLSEAAAVPAVGITAYHALYDVARIRAGDSILIQAVAGGVGLTALQLCKHTGLQTYGTASSPEKLALAGDHGLDHGIDYAHEDFEYALLQLTGGRGVDRVLDSLGGQGLRKGYRCLAPGGLLVTIGAAQVAPPDRNPLSMLRAGVELARGGLFHPFDLIERNRGIAGVQVLLLWDDLPLLDRAMGEIVELWEAGVLRPHIDRVVDLQDAAVAHTLLQSRASRGKLLLRCAGPDA